MKIVVIGGSGLIGSKVVSKLKAKGHELVAASPSSGVDATTGKGLAEALKGAEVVVDVANSPSFEEKAVLAFFGNSGRHLAEEEKAAGVKHHVALSVVGTERLANVGYFKGKLLQEKLIKASGIPYTIVQSTQFFEFLNSIAQAGTAGQTVQISSAFFQPIAAEDVASVLADVALQPPLNNTIEIAGPERIRMSDLIQNYLKAMKDLRMVTADANALYFGTKLTDDTLNPGRNHRLGKINFDQWLSSR